METKDFKRKIKVAIEVHLFYLQDVTNQIQYDKLQPSGENILKQLHNHEMRHHIARLMMVRLKVRNRIGYCNYIKEDT